MTYEEFKRELYCNVATQTGAHNRWVRLLEKGMRIHSEELLWTLGEQRQGCKSKMMQEDYLCVQWNWQSPMKSWNVHVLYEKFKHEGWQGILPEILGELPKPYTRKMERLSGNNAYEMKSEQLIIRPINYRLNREELMDCIFWRFGDIALVLYTQLGDIGNDYVTMKIHRSMTDGWNISEERVLTNALLNSYALMPPRLFQAGDIRFSYKWEEGVFMPKEPGIRVEIDSGNEQEGLRGYRLTTTKGKNGAIAIFYPGVQECIWKLMKGDYLVGFTSIHEAVIHPVCYKNPNEMKAAIRHINAVFDEKDMLTNTVYRYCHRKGKMIEI